MELNQLRYFQKVARTESVTRAAQELFISQPTLSQSLGRLESSLGVELFLHQPGRRLQLNDAGKLFLQKVDAAFAELEQGVSQVRELAGCAGTQVSVASSIHDLCSELTITFLRAHPDTRVSLRLVEINDLTDLLLTDEVDFAISPCPLPDVRLESFPLYTEELMAVVGPGHRLFGRASCPLGELRGERFILNYSESDRNYLELLFGEDGEQFDVVLESNEPDVIRRAVSAGLGVAFRPARLVMRRRKEHDAPEPNWALRITDAGAAANTPTCISRKKGRFLLRAASAFYDDAVAYCQRESALVQEFLAHSGA